MIRWPCIRKSKIKQSEFGWYVNEHDATKGMIFTVHTFIIIIGISIVTSVVVGVTLWTAGSGGRGTVVTAQLMPQIQ